jgi:DNA-binding response OmpR family regulator
MHMVLYVDGHPAMARAVERWLAGRGTGVQPARTIAEARRRFEAADYEGVFVDLWLDDGSGFELYDWILEHRPALADRVAFVTADIVQHSAEHERFRLLDRPVLVKPFDLAELDRCVDQWVGGEASD